jgi:hypothetical protein
MANDRIETIPEMINFLQPILELFKKDNAKLTVLDPCFCLGQSIQNFKQFDYVNLIHSPEMNVGKSLEVNRDNLQFYLNLEMDLIITNMPWSSRALAQVLEIMCIVSDRKNIPLLFLIPHRCSVTNRFYDVMQGKRLVKWDLPNWNFKGYEGAGSLDTRTMAWYGYNWTHEKEGWNVMKPSNQAFIFEQK